MDISPLHRLVVIVARGHIAAEEIAATTRQPVEANVPAYAKIIDVSQATSELTREQVQKVADLLRGAPGDTSRGPVAFVINPDRIGFANVFADVTQGRTTHPVQRPARGPGMARSYPTGVIRASGQLSDVGP